MLTLTRKQHDFLNLWITHTRARTQTLTHMYFVTHLAHLDPTLSPPQHNTLAAPHTHSNHTHAHMHTQTHFPHRQHPPSPHTHTHTYAHKHITHTHTIASVSGLYDLMHDNITEHPSTINILARMNVYQEVVLAAIYKATPFLQVRACVRVCAR